MFLHIGLRPLFLGGTCKLSRFEDREIADNETQLLSCAPLRSDALRLLALKRGVS